MVLSNSAHIIGVRVSETIAETKIVDLNARDVDQAMKVIEGTARSMGIDVVG